ISKGVNFAMNGFNAVANFATGNFLGAATSVVSMFGGGGGDAAAARHAQVMAALRKIMELQVETLKAVQNLHNFVAEQFLLTHYKIDDIRKAVQDVKNILYSELILKHDRACQALSSHYEQA